MQVDELPGSGTGQSKTGELDCSSCEAHLVFISAELLHFIGFDSHGTNRRQWSWNCLVYALGRTARGRCRGQLGGDALSTSRRRCDGQLDVRAGRWRRAEWLDAVDGGDLSQLIAVFVDVGKERRQRDDVSSNDATYSVHVVDTYLARV